MSLRLRSLLALVPVVVAAAACSPALGRESAAPHETLECAGGVVQSTAELDRFAACDVVTGDLEIRGGDALDLRGLANLRRVDGSLVIADNPKLSSLSGLARLRRVERLELRDNPELTSLRGLEGVRDLDALVLRKNGLRNVKGLDNLRTVGDLIVANHRRLLSLSALGQLREARSIRIEKNPQLAAQPGLLPSLVRVGESVELSANGGLSASDVRALVARPGLVAEVR